MEGKEKGVLALLVSYCLVCLTVFVASKDTNTEKIFACIQNIEKTFSKYHNQSPLKLIIHK